MRRRAGTSFLLVAGVGLAALVIVAGVRGERDAFTLGVATSGPAVRVAPGHETCQLPVATPEAFGGVRIKIGTFGRESGPAADVLVRRADDDQILTRTTTSGYADNETVTVTFPREIPADQAVSVCLANRGSGPLAPYGSSPLSNRTSDAYLDGRPVAQDISLVFVRADERSLLGLLPAVLDHASLFHGSWTSTGFYWVLLAVAVLVVPLLLLLAVRSSVDEAS